MSDPDAAVSVLSAEHSRAIREEVGERLRNALAPASDLPARLAKLLERLAEQDREAPSIVPSLEEMETAGPERLVEAA